MTVAVRRSDTKEESVCLEFIVSLMHQQMQRGSATTWTALLDGARGAIQVVVTDGRHSDPANASWQQAIDLVTTRAASRHPGLLDPWARALTLNGDNRNLIRPSRRSIRSATGH